VPPEAVVGWQPGRTGLVVVQLVAGPAGLLLFGLHSEAEVTGVPDAADIAPLARPK